MPRGPIGIGLLIAASLVGVSRPATADHGPVIVVPTTAGVPIYIDGVEASGAVVVGDWGLYRPGHVHPVVIRPPYFDPRYRSRPYFPSAGRPPRYGRHELIPPPRRRAPTDYERHWSTPASGEGFQPEGGPAPLRARN